MARNPLVHLHRISVVASGGVVPLLGAALDERADEVALAYSVALWMLWGVMLLCVLVPSSVSLTAVRISTAFHTVTVASATVIHSSDPDGLGATTVCAFALSLVTSLVALTAEVGNHHVQQSSYGDEQRFLLKAPTALAVAQSAMFVIWSASAYSAATLLLAGRWAIGAPVAALAIALTAILPTRFHRFSRRWLVAVPAGLVVHDHVILAETAMFTRRAVTSISVRRSVPAADAPSDLTGGLDGGIVVGLADFDTVVLAPSRRGALATPVHLKSFAVRPSRVTNALASLTRP